MRVKYCQVAHTSIPYFSLNVHATLIYYFNPLSILQVNPFLWFWRLNGLCNCILKYGIKIQYNYGSTIPFMYAYLSLKSFFAVIKSQNGATNKTRTQMLYFAKTNIDLCLWQSVTLWIIAHKHFLRNDIACYYDFYYDDFCIKIFKTSCMILQNNFVDIPYASMITQSSIDN